MPNELFKFVKSSYIDDVLHRGMIRVTKLSHFRKLAAKAWIADPNEATTIVDAGGAKLAAGPGESLSDTFTPPGFSRTALASDGGTVQFSAGARLAYVAPDDRFIFSLSCGEKDVLVQTMCQDAIEPYDAAVRVRIPLELLGHRIFHRGRIVELNDEPVGRHFMTAEYDRISYKSIIHHHSAGIADAPSPFVKEARFAAQSEVRIALIQSRKISREWLTIALPRPDKIFAEEFRAVT